MDQHRITVLLEQYLNGVINEADANELRAWFGQTSLDEFEKTIAAAANIPAMYKEPATMKESFGSLLEKRLDEMDAQQLDQDLHPDRKGGIRLLHSPLLRYAAIILVILIGTLWLYTMHSSNRKTHQAIVTPQDVMPGSRGATLTLTDGRVVELDSLNKGRVAVQNGTEILYNNNRLTYNPGEAADAGFNTISTPRGREFHLELPDGSHVWLNAESSITYPTVFLGGSREVKVSGELYFEVTKDAAKPFIVKVDDKMQVRVLGTHFNINAYRDNGLTKTTLIEGAVEVKNNNQSMLLKPGQQASAGNQGDFRLVNDVNIEQVIAWKKGLFNFNGYDIQAMMREIARWYDLEVVYESVPAYEEMRGGIQRNLTLIQVMNILKKVNINYRLEGRKLIITK